MLETLAADANPAVRELAAEKLGDVATSDLPGFRRMMRAPARLTRGQSRDRRSEVNLMSVCEPLLRQQVID